MTNLNLDNLSKKTAEKKIDEVLKGKINLFQYYEILVWALKTYKTKDDLYATCYFAEDSLEVKKEDILAMPFDHFALIYKERKGQFNVRKYLDILSDVNLFFKLYEKLPMTTIGYDILDYLNRNSVSKADAIRIANSNLGFSLILRASYTPQNEKYIPAVKTLICVIEDEVKKIYLLSQFNEKLFLEATKTVSEKILSRAVEEISERRQQKILSEKSLVKLKEISREFYDVYCDKLVKAS